MWKYYLQREQDKKYRASRVKLTTLAAVKLFLALSALALAIFLEYEHQLVSLVVRMLTIYWKRNHY